jgi:hypothetical protein
MGSKMLANRSDPVRGGHTSASAKYGAAPVFGKRSMMASDDTSNTVPLLRLTGMRENRLATTRLVTLAGGAVTAGCTEGPAVVLDPVRSYLSKCRCSGIVARVPLLDISKNACCPCACQSEANHARYMLEVLLYARSL